MLVSGHREFDYEELLTATLALQRGAALFATSRDPTLPMPGGRLARHRRGPRRRRDRVRGRAPRSAASPSGISSTRPRADSASAGRVAMVGDRIASDIEGGRRAGLATILVLSGATSRQEAAAADRAPDHVLDDLAALLRMSVAMSRTSAGPVVPGPGSPSPAIFAVTFCGLLAVGAVLPVLPRYVHGPLDGGNIAVGIVVGSYAVTGLLLRPFAGRFADRRGRKPTVLVGSVLVAAAGFLYLLPLGVAGLIRRAPRARRGRGRGLHRRLGLDRRPGPDRPRRGRVIGLYGLAVWSGLSIGPLIGELPPARLRLHRGLALRRSAAAGRGRDRHCACPTRSGRCRRSRTSTSR